VGLGFGGCVVICVGVFVLFAECSSVWAWSFVWVGFGSLMVFSFDFFVIMLVAVLFVCWFIFWTVYLLVLCLFCIFVDSFVLMVIAVTPFRSYFVWLEFCCVWCFVIGVSFLFCVWYYFYFTVCPYGGLFCCVLWVGCAFYDLWGCFVFFRCGVALCFVW